MGTDTSISIVMAGYVATNSATNGASRPRSDAMVTRRSLGGGLLGMGAVLVLTSGATTPEIASDSMLRDFAI
jgi:hypothetical protein